MITGYTTYSQGEGIDSAGNFHKGAELVDGSTITINGSSLQFGTTTGTFTLGNLLSGEITIESFEFKETNDGNFIEVVKRQKSNSVYTVYPPQDVPDRVWKEIYGIKRGKSGKKELHLIKTIEGHVTPGHYVEESVEFDE